MAMSSLSPVDFSSRTRTPCSHPVMAAHPPRTRTGRRSVVLTREKGKNEKMKSLLHSRGISTLEVPVIEHNPGPDLNMLPVALKGLVFEWIVLTSPEAASIFLEGWKMAGSPPVRLAVVGSGTAEVFQKAEGAGLNITVDFIPSKANARNLLEEFPMPEVARGIVLYPASKQADHAIEKGLSERGFEVMRLNTYSTDFVRWIDPPLLDCAISAPVVALASPTAVWSWVDLIDLTSWTGAAACIGEVTACAAKKAGLKKVYYQDNPGLDGRVTSIGVTGLFRRVTALPILFRRVYLKHWSHKLVQESDSLPIL